MRRLLREFAAPNMLDLHPPRSFQIDGTASRDRTIELVPPPGTDGARVLRLWAGDSTTVAFMAVGEG